MKRTQHMTKSNKIVAIILSLCILVLLSVSAVIFFRSGDEEKQAKVPVATTGPSDLPSPTSPYEAPLKAATIMYMGDGFAPDSITVAKGAEVNFLNFSEEIVDVESLTGQELLNLGKIQVQKDVNLKFDSPGQYPYHNKLKPEEKGVIFVK